VEYLNRILCSVLSGIRWAVSLSILCRALWALLMQDPVHIINISTMQILCKSRSRATYTVKHFYSRLGLAPHNDIIGGKVLYERFHVQTMGVRKGWAPIAEGTGGSWLTQYASDSISSASKSP